MAVGKVERESRRVERLSQAEAVSWNSSAEAGGREEAAGGNNGQGHLSCVDALPFTYNGTRGPASGGFLFSPLLSGDTSGPYNRPFVPSPLFCQRLTLRVCSFFCLFSLSPLENKT